MGGSSSLTCHLRSLDRQSPCHTLRRPLIRPVSRIQTMLLCHPPRRYEIWNGNRFSQRSNKRAGTEERPPRSSASQHPHSIDAYGITIWKDEDSCISKKGKSARMAQDVRAIFLQRSLGYRTAGFRCSRIGNRGWINLDLISRHEGTEEW